MHARVLLILLYPWDIETAPVAEHNATFAVHMGGVCMRLSIADTAQAAAPNGADNATFAVHKGGVCMRLSIADTAQAAAPNGAGSMHTKRIKPIWGRKVWY